MKIQSIQKRMRSFEILQEILDKLTILYYFIASFILWVDLDTFKKFEIKIIAFHFKDNAVIKKDKWFCRTQILSVMFLSRQLTSTKRNYWFTELKIFELMWTIKKIKRLIQSLQHRVIIQTNYQTIVDICAQTLITIINSIIRINIRLIRAFQFLSQFNLNVCYKSD